MLLGIISVVQAVFLPGYLALRLARHRSGSLIESGVLAFALSLLINCLYVFCLTALGWHGRTSVIALLAAEAIIALALLLRAQGAVMRDGVRIHIPTVRLDRWLPAYTLAVSTTVLGVATTAALTVAIRYNVFTAWDAVFSWNRWAYDWMQGILPVGPVMYPQLIPANWSMMYLIMGNPELQCFPLAIMPLFGVGVLAMFLDLGLRRRRLEYLFALLLCVFMFWQWRGNLFALNENILGGYVDIPVTFMAMAALYVIELRADRRLPDVRALALPLVLAGAASVTKLNGAYVLAVVLALGLVGHVRNRGGLSPRDWLKSGLLTVVALAVIPGTWWGMRAFRFATGRDTFRMAGYESALTASGAGRGLLQRLGHAAGLIPGSPLLLAAAVLVIALALLARRSRWVVLGILLPYTLLWAYFLSYDVRNLLMMLPVAAYCAAYGVGWLLQRRWLVDMRLAASHGSRTVTPRALLATLGILVAFIATVSLRFPASKLTSEELMLQTFIGNQYLNPIVYDALTADQSVKGDLLTDYAYLKVLPGFRNEPYRLQSGTRFRVAYAHQGSVTVDDLDGKACLLLSDLVPKEVSDVIDRRIEDGSYTVLAEYDSGPYTGGYGVSDFTVRLIKTNG